MSDIYLIQTELNFGIFNFLEGGGKGGRNANVTSIDYNFPSTKTRRYGS